MSNEIK